MLATTAKLESVRRPWGWFEIVHQSEAHWTKILTVSPFQSLSLQAHRYRTEFWTPIDYGLSAEIHGKTIDMLPGIRYDVPRGVKHRVTNTGIVPARFIEVAIGFPDEDDIIRFEDKYGRAT